MNPLRENWKTQALIFFFAGGLVAMNIHPDSALIYDFDVKVKNGLQDFFSPSNHADAIRVKINVINGLVKNE